MEIKDGDSTRNVNEDQKKRITSKEVPIGGATGVSTSIRPKPSKEIYKPPNLRRTKSGSHVQFRRGAKSLIAENPVLYDKSEQHTRLNPNAPEFQFPQRSSEPIVHFDSALLDYPHHLHRISGRGTLFVEFQKHCRLGEEKSDMPLKHSKSSGNISGKQKVRFSDEGLKPSPSFSIFQNQASCEFGSPHIKRGEPALHQKQHSNFESIPFIKNPKLKRSASFGQRLTNEPLSPFWAEYIQLNKWPIPVAETLKISLGSLWATGSKLEERIPARHKIDIVTRILATVMGDYIQDVSPHANEHDKIKNQLAFVLPASHIFLHFIQEDKDSTVLETLLNSSLALYRNLIHASTISTQEEFERQPGAQNLTSLSLSSPSKWIIFIHFLLTLYQKAKSTCTMNQGKGRDVEGKRLRTLYHRLLALLSDCCRVLLQNSNSGLTSEMMESIFIVMTSVGHDMEMSFPNRMKEFLAVVRDALLGVGKDEGKRHELSSNSLKILMQIIELRAANWQLPASAVRYYYSKNSNNDISN